MTDHLDSAFSVMPSSRHEAKLLNVKRYFTGKPCHRGHIAPRLTSTGRCRDCDRIDVVAWRDANPERQRATYDAYYAANREKYLSRNSAWHTANPERRKEIVADYHARHPEKSRIWKAAYRKRNPEKARAAVAAWNAANPERVRALKRNRKALQRAAEGTHTADDIVRILKTQKGKCAGCDKKIGKDRINWHVDHIHPIAKGGSNKPDNLQILCPTCNMRKGAKDPNAFNRECFGRLL